MIWENYTILLPDPNFKAFFLTWLGIESRPPTLEVCKAAEVVSQFLKRTHTFLRCPPISLQLKVKYVFILTIL